MAERPSRSRSRSKYELAAADLCIKVEALADRLEVLETSHKALQAAHKALQKENTDLKKWTTWLWLLHDWLHRFFYHAPKWPAPAASPEGDAMDSR
jgi:hypothetical protein